MQREDRDEDLLRRINYASGKIHRYFHPWVSREDIRAELANYAFTTGHKIFTRWLNEDAHYRVYLALYGAGRQFAEREKAAQSGYNFEDIAWYTDRKIREVLPLALDPLWDGLTGEPTADAEDGEGRRRVSGRTPAFETGTLNVMVADVRSALKSRPAAARVVTSGMADDMPEYGIAVEELIGFLGGGFPEARGYARRSA